MALRVEKKFRFEAAHRIIDGYEGDCTNIHGHTWHVVIELTLRDGQDLDQYGFVAELAELAPIKQMIAQQWDHAIILNARDPLRAVLSQRIFDVGGRPHRMIILEGNPTIENIAQVFKAKAAELLNSDRCYVSKVVVQETPFQQCTLEVDA